MVLCVKVIAPRIDPLAAVAGILDGKRAAGHGEIVVGLHASRSAVFGVLIVPGHPAGDRDHVRAVFHQHIIVGGDAFFHIAGRGHDERTA